jgi:beta-carotene hydroxylase
MPSLDSLGRDLLHVSPLRRGLSLATPFVLTGLFFALSAQGWWIPALVCPVLLSFLTYGSISHDLVHRNLRLDRWLNEALLSAIELICFRSGHAYRSAHLYHHAHFPEDGDLEGAAARMTWWRALLDGVTLQPRLWWFALTRSTSDRRWIEFEGAGVLSLVGASAVAIPWTPLPALYAGLMIAGSWLFPIATAFIPHDAHGTSTLTQTRLYRGRMLSLLALEHLYHLEHHLYPQVPHHNWRRLAERLDPYFERAGLQPHKLLF